MNAPDPLCPTLPSAAEWLRHLPSIAVLGGIAALFAGVGIGLPGKADEAALASAAAGLERAEDGALIPMAPTAPEALAPISALEAWEMNANLPTAAGAVPAAAAFTLPADEVAQMRSVDCLTAAVYYEAGLESLDGQRAVAQVVLNRVRHPHYPNTVCGVVFQGHTRRTGCQFTFTCDGALRRTPAAHLWERSRGIAQAALAGYVHRPVGRATHYHANYVFPYWAPTLTKIATIGAHIFYRWDSYGSGTVRYAGAEPDIRWRGGFGQPDRQLANSTTAVTGEGRDAAAAAAAADALKEGDRGGTSFQRSIMRRYEPVSTTAQEIVERRATSNVGPSASTRWSISGQPDPNAAPQRPFGREGTQQPVQLEGVRRRPAAETPAAPEPSVNSTEAR